MRKINRQKETKKKSQFFGNKASGAATLGVLKKSCSYCWNIIKNRSSHRGVL